MNISTVENVGICVGAAIRTVTGEKKMGAGASIICSRVWHVLLLNSALIRST